MHWLISKYITNAAFLGPGDQWIMLCILCVYWCSLCFILDTFYCNLLMCKIYPTILCNLLFILSTVFVIWHYSFPIYKIIFETSLWFSWRYLILQHTTHSTSKYFNDSICSFYNICHFWVSLISQGNFNMIIFYLSKIKYIF